MEIQKSVSIVYTKESLIDLVIANAREAGYSVDRKAVKFINKRGNKSDFKSIVVNELAELTPLPETPPEKEDVEPESKD